MEEQIGIKLFLENGREIKFRNLDGENYRGWLPGSLVKECTIGPNKIVIQSLQHSFFSISYRVFQFFKDVELSIIEKPLIRFEALLSGELQLVNDHADVKLKSGYYHVTDIPLFKMLFKGGRPCSIFVFYYSKEFLEEEGLKLLPCDPRKMPIEMSKTIIDIINNPYSEKLRNFFYYNSIRDLLFFHLTHNSQNIPSELKHQDIEAIYKADNIIASDLEKHYTIGKLARMTGTNQFKLKKGFQKIFGMGVFHRLLFRRMEYAKKLLETTNKSIGEIAELSGYDTAAGFINAFRKRFGMTPREWRQNVHNKEEDNI